MDIFGKRSVEGGEYGAVKKQRTDGTPGAVLHVRGLPSFATELELISLVQPYGQVVKCLLLQAKQQAFLQMDSAASAQKVIASAELAPMQIRGKTIYFQFSNKHSEVSTKSSGGGADGDFKTVGGSGEQPNSILLVSILNARVPVTLENIHQVFKPYGEVLKIITFMKDGVFQVLVQMGTVDSAINAKLLLEGKDMFQGCCTLRIAFSQRQQLVVKQQSAKSRDFLAPYTPPTPGLFGAGAGLGGAADPYWGLGLSGAGFPQAANSQALQSFASGGAGVGGSAGGPSSVVLVNKLTEKATPDVLFTLFGVYGDVVRVKILYNKRDTAMVQYSNSQQANFAVQYLNKVPLNGQELVVSNSKNNEIKMPNSEQEAEHGGLTKDYHSSPLHRYKKGLVNAKSVNPPSQVLHVSNIYEGCTQEELVELFQSVQKNAPIVQFFANSRKMAYVRMDSIADAVQGLIQCHNHKLGTWNIRVSFSHKDANSMKEGETTAQEFDESKLQGLQAV